MYEACSSKDGASIGEMRELVQQGRTGVSFGEFELFFSKVLSHHGTETLTPSVFSQLLAEHEEELLKLAFNDGEIKQIDLLEQIEQEEDAEARQSP
jgi:hypothetical protein